MEVTVYTFEDAEGVEQEYHTFDAREAEQVGRLGHYQVIANEYEFSDSYPVPEWDFRPYKRSA